MKESEIKSPMIDSLPEFLNGHDLVCLGLYSTKNAVYLARYRGQSPDYIKIGRKVVYPKKNVIEFLKRHARSGSKSKQKLNQ